MMDPIAILKLAIALARAMNIEVSTLAAYIKQDKANQNYYDQLLITIAKSPPVQ